ncbi:putative carboxylesterase [Gordonia araii NBRC 100433]|uniref:Putative carboxylesterase n=1 Tax=Gordonia araii NBRC 100433 TaxID=1073574 RepID=G7GY11_9ACTN|nr:alpha/beta hydrolase fold domain-containing protein [Gordonia araii]NNG98097.1 alpha/beta hydrolase fold domain-containing protein [Gordonia araii NBRC 100433]GAB08486.1 putative carboxylesterase [Gordonia araii NBRC 100433]
MSDNLTPPARAVAFEPHTSLTGRLAAVGARLFVKPVIWMWSRALFLPWPYRLLDIAASLLPAVRGVTRSRVDLPNCTAERMFPKDAAPDGSASSAILYLHGGAFVVGGIRSHRRLVSRLVRESGIGSLAVDYRKLPSSPVSSAIADGIDALEYLLRTGIPSERIAVVGDSAGGFLALHVALEARRRGLGRVGAVGLISPIIDLEPTSKLDAVASMGGEPDPLFPRAALSALWELVQRTEADQAACDRLRSAALGSAELGELPPVHIQVGSSEILRPDTDRLLAACVAGGGTATVEVFAGQVHVFQAGADVIPEGRRAIASMAGHLVAALTSADRRAA